MALRELDWILSINGGANAKKEIEGIDKTVDKLKENMNSADKVMSKGGGFTAMLSGASRKMKSFGDNALKAGAKMTLATAPLMLGVKKGFTDALDIDNHIRQVQTLADATVLPVEQLRKSVKTISHDAAISQQEVSSAMYEALSSGIETKDVVGFTNQGIKLAKAGFTDLGTVIDATTSVLNAYGDQAYGVEKIQDIFVKTQDLGKITVDELGKSIGRVIPTAASAGVNVDQLGASYSLLTSRGMNAHIATTSLNSMLSELSSTGTTADKVLRQRTGKNFSQLTADGKDLSDVLTILNESATANGKSLGDMFGNVNSARAAQSMLQGGADAYKGFLKEMQNADGAVDKNFKTMVEGSKGFKWEQAKTDMKNAMADVGDSVAPQITDLADKVGDLAQKFSELSPEAQGAIGKFSLMALAAGPIVGIFGGISKFAGMLIGGLATISGVVGWPATVALLLLGTAAGYMATHWDETKAAVQRVNYVLGSGFTAAKDAAVTAIGEANAAQDTMVSTITSSEATFGEKVQSIINWWNSLRAILSRPIEAFVNVVKRGFSGGGTIKAPGGGSGGGSRGRSRPSAFATGTDYIPYDNFPAYLHKGEMVLTAEASNQYRSMGGTKDGLDTTTFRGKPSGGGGNFSPTINIEINGNADDNTANSIASVVRRELESLFTELQLQQV